MTSICGGQPDGETFSLGVGAPGHGDETALSYTLRERKEFAISRESTALEMSANRPGECNEKKRAK